MQEITVTEIKERLSQGENIYMIDVREDEEYQKRNNNAQLIPLPKIQAFELDDIQVAKEDEIVVLCKSGKRSLLACLFLEQVGYTNVKSMKGGIDAW